MLIKKKKQNKRLWNECSTLNRMSTSHSEDSVLIVEGLGQMQAPESVVDGCKKNIFLTTCASFCKAVYLNSKVILAYTRREKALARTNLIVIVSVDKQFVISLDS